MSKKTLIILAIPIVLFTAVPFALPESIESIGGFQEVLSRTIKDLPEFFKEIRQGFINALEQIWSWIKTIWSSYIRPFFQNIWQKTKDFFLREYERRKSSAEEEFVRDKEQLKEKVKSLIIKIPLSLWAKIKGLFK